MLFDPKWEVQTKPDVLSLESLIAWLETMPASDGYEYYECRGRCLYGQYMASHGVPWMESGHYDRADSTPRAAFCGTVYSEVACEVPYTFGAALDRARRALGK